MIAPHEIPATGPGAAFAARMQAMLPVIETERLRLRAPRIEDFPAYAQIAEGPSGKFLIDNPSRDGAWFDFTQIVATWILRGHGLWTVELLTGGDLLGFVLLGFEPGDHEPELGYLFRASAEGHGYASEAAIAARRHAYKTLGMRTLVSAIDPDNSRSIRLAERLGATRDDAAEAAHGHEVLIYRHPAPEDA